MILIKLYDYTHVIKGHYFINISGTIVLVDIDYGSIKISGYRLKLYFIFCKRRMKKVQPDDPLYDEVIQKYRKMLRRVIRV